MTLAASGNLSLGTNLYGATRCIRYEILGGYGSYTLSAAKAAKTGPSTNNMSGFYGYSHCADPTPSTPASRTASDIGPGIISVGWASTTYADNYTHRRSTNGSSWTSTLTTSSTSYSTSIALGNWYWQVRANGCNGSSSYGNMSPYPVNIN